MLVSPALGALRQATLYHIKEPKPLVLRGPPEGTLRTIVQRDVDAIVADGIPIRVGDGLVLMLPVEAGRDLVIESEGVPGEPSTPVAASLRRVRRCAAGRPKSAGEGGREMGSRTAGPAVPAFLVRMR